MAERKPTTRTMKSSEARQEWSRILNQVFRRETRVIVEKSGLPVAAIVATEDLESLIRLERERAERFKPLQETWEAFKDVPEEEIEREAARAIAEVRRKNRRRTRRVPQAS